MIDKFNPPIVHGPDGNSHVTISNVGRLAHLADQCPLSISGEVVGEPGGYAAQTEQVTTNLRDHPHRPFPQLLRIRLRSCHLSILPTQGSLYKIRGGSQ